MFVCSVFKLSLALSSALVHLPLISCQGTFWTHSIWAVFLRFVGEVLSCSMTMSNLYHERSALSRMHCLFCTLLMQV